MKYSIFDHRTIIGYANTLQHARKVISKLIDVSPRATLHVWHRNTDIVELPAGIVYAISWGKK